MGLNEFYGYCPVCGSEVEPVRCYRVLSDYLGREWFLAACSDCGVGSVYPPLTHDEAMAWFKDESKFKSSIDPEGKSRSFIDELDLKIAREYRPLADDFTKIAPCGSVLDVGCGLGGFLSCLSPEKYRRLGCDVNGFAASFAREKCGADIYNVDVLDLDLPHESLDAITLIQVFDHIERPDLFLKKAYSLLRAGGALFMTSIINLNSPMSKLFRGGFRLLHPSHIWYFSPSTIRRILTRFGFSCENISFPYWRTPYATAVNHCEILKKLMILAGKRIIGNGDFVLSQPFWGNVMTVTGRKI